MKLFFVVLCILIEFSLAKHYEAINRCISYGERHAKIHQNCHHIPHYITHKINQKFHQLCINSFKIACNDIINDDSCEKIVGIAKLNDDCDKYKSVTFKNCCIKCKFGSLFKSIFNHCNFSTLNLNKKSSKTIQNCCESSCAIGYQRNQLSNKCEDINECLNNSHNCTKSQICKNEIGSFRCERNPCPHGFKAAQNSNSDETECIDINECEENENLCGNEKICSNLIGSYECKAIDVLSVRCDDGFEMKNGDCVDIDECEREGLCGKRDVCRNLIGSYGCETIY